jgi:hypothetical protein
MLVCGLIHSCQIKACLYSAVSRWDSQIVLVLARSGVPFLALVRLEGNERVSETKETVTWGKESAI